MGKYLKSVGKNSLDFLKYVGPGLLVTVGFIDPGNWASNIAAGSGYGYSLLWMVTLSTVMLIILHFTPNGVMKERVILLQISMIHREKMLKAL